MNEIRILHLFPRLLSLYGDYGNVAVLKKLLEQNGYTVTVTEYEGGPLDLDQNFLYAGSGTEDNLLIALERLQPHADALRAAVESGKLLLATGNAMSLFGKTLTRGEKTMDAIGICDYESVIDDSRRFLGDVLTGKSFAGHPCVGFINNSCVYSGIREPLLQFKLGAKLGNDKQSCADGVHCGSFYATQLIGPFLAKNPYALLHIAQELTGSSLALPESANAMLSYKVACEELEKQLA